MRFTKDDPVPGQVRLLEKTKLNGETLYVMEKWAREKPDQPYRWHFMCSDTVKESAVSEWTKAQRETVVHTREFYDYRD